MFFDRAKIKIRSGNGGNGHVSFHREKYVTNGGPDGGDGGKGGDIIFTVDKGMNTLIDFRHKRKYFAQNGENGGKRNCTGRSGENLVIRVPEGTLIKDAFSGMIIADMSGENLTQTILRGGRGGKGNQHFATPTMQIPRYAQPGKEGIELDVELELKVIADVGLIGFPNVGKSTFLASVSNAQPKIANYHFTTLSPNLGVVQVDVDKSFVLADIPGLIEGASSGAGLGHYFLRHVERTRLLVHVIDGAGLEGRDPLKDIDLINNELETYSEKLAQKPQIIVANKCDAMLEEDKEELRKTLENKFGKDNVFMISAVARQGIQNLLYKIYDMLSTMPREIITFEPEFEVRAVDNSQLPICIEKIGEGEFEVSGERIEKMLGYTNLEDEKGFAFFQKFMKDTGIIDRLKELGLEEKDTVHVCDLSFEYYE